MHNTFTCLASVEVNRPKADYWIWLLCGCSHTTARSIVPAYTKYNVHLIKVAPEDGLIQSETCRTSNGK